MKRERTGFTLIELLVVVLILGILTSVAVPALYKSLEESRAAEPVSNIGAYIYAQEDYFMRFGTYSDNQRDLNLDFTDLSYFTVTEIGKKITFTRTKNAGGNLGKWSISMTMPNQPREGVYLWECVPMPACKYLLPANQVGGVIKSAN